MCHSHRIDKAETSHNGRNPLDSQALIQAEQEKDNESVYSLQFCKLKHDKSEKEGHYQELDRLVKEQFIQGISGQYIQK